ncbi:MAG TPA: hypothetical protein VKZ49_11370 [Polyangiaceae bacterium]|nr:hypothetical protein [Polyangiaceae bacterium]
MPSCYLLALCSGSVLDQQTNNVTLFNLVEQINVPAGAPPPPNRVVPLEIHAYFQLASSEVGQSFEVRFALVAASGLETFSDVLTHRSSTPRYRTRTLGLPMPPVAGQYELRVDWRLAGSEGFQREPTAWPVNIVEMAPPPAVVH